MEGLWHVRGFGHREMEKSVSDRANSRAARGLWAGRCGRGRGFGGALVSGAAFCICEGDPECRLLSRRNR